MRAGLIKIRIVIKPGNPTLWQGLSVRSSLNYYRLCEACEQPAPFVDSSNFPFLEVHHVRHLADGGSDTVTNAVALCPNCHRRLHYSKDSKDYRESLFHKVPELVKE